MDEEYDVIVLGTGLTECVISGLLSVSGKKVLHMDRNDYYGGKSASLNLKQFFEMFKPGVEDITKFGSSRDWNIDIVPKFVMAAGKLVRILSFTKVTRYLDFLQVEGSFVYRAGKIHKVPSKNKEARKSELMGWLEKIRCAKFLSFVEDFEEDKPCKKPIPTMTMEQLFDDFSIKPDTREFLGHAVALHTSDDYLLQPALPSVLRLKLYNESLERYGVSPYIYPLYGLGELPQAFARLSAVYGGTYMLNKPIDSIEYDEAGHVTGVTSSGETARCKIVVGDPSYFTKRVKSEGHVVRCVCFINHKVEGTLDAEAYQIIIPQNQVGRKHDIYVSCISSKFNVCPAGWSVVIASTTVETETPEAELAPALALFEPIQEKAFIVEECFVPLDDGKKDGVFISKSYDATSHFESTSDDVLSLYERIMGEPLDWTALPTTSVDDDDME
uniref:Rab GDP dissociation inhibitor n=1 Tax=Stygiella incarcerata TaxID=1712417 RepID=A0A192ZHW3_9EUKA|nr:Rab GDP dissociation inhibitor beta [Stygiella incarcerata]|eukprot:TRINITY_DN2999_c0_g1_i1.p1 TRINITY_DN2999_c0_g1~~TRINITY_DN2999_c0_g1_i1.p1  ORF type:complete len:479 (-),score=119.64 TRINITY_DN2999_c0_g1_i1:272-1600(-)